MAVIASCAGGNRCGARPWPAPPAPSAAMGTGVKGGRKVVVPVSVTPRPVNPARTPSPATPPVLPWSVPIPSVV